MTKYKEAIDEWNSLIAAHDDVPNADEIFNIESSLKKIEIFYSCHDLGKFAVYSIGKRPESCLFIGSFAEIRSYICKPSSPKSQFFAMP